MKVIVNKEDSWKLDSSMFCLEGSWETGYVLDKDIFFMVGVRTYCEVGESSPMVPIIDRNPASTLRVMPSEAWGWDYDIDYIEEFGPLWIVNVINNYGYMFKP